MENSAQAKGKNYHSTIYKYIGTKCMYLKINNINMLTVACFLTVLLRYRCVVPFVRSSVYDSYIELTVNYFMAFSFFCHAAVSIIDRLTAAVWQSWAVDTCCQWCEDYTMQACSQLCMVKYSFTTYHHFSRYPSLSRQTCHSNKHLNFP